ncbi:MAG: hypothetical protein GC168_18175 [Candidatus Hydrogenedens sp.]|nr:hypothetical protein [Candidatus Hydrogenedens sp.]
MIQSEGIFAMLFRCFLLAACVCASVASAQENLVQNGGFEQWADAQPQAWSCSRKAGDGWEIAAVKPVEDAKEGRFAIELPNPETAGGLTIIGQDISATGVKPGGTVIMRLWGKADASGQLHLVVGFDRKGERRKVRRVHSGSGQWEQVEWMFDLPENADPKSLRVEIMNKGGGKAPALVDQVELIFKELDAQFELPENAHE